MNMKYKSLFKHITKFLKCKLLFLPSVDAAPARIYTARLRANNIIYCFEVVYEPLEELFGMFQNVCLLYSTPVPSALLPGQIPCDCLVYYTVVSSNIGV
jgi:hypothetical protein